MLLAAVVLTFTASARTDESHAQAAGGVADDPGRAMLDRLCSGCHASNLVASRLRTPAEWDDTIGLMQSYGSEGTAEQLAVLRAYLLRNHGRANVNTAPAGDLAPVLDVAVDVAAAVVKYRSDNGSFKTVEDLQRVPGLDGARLEARKDRLTF
jgi:competence protein ComEA